MVGLSISNSIDITGRLTSVKVNPFQDAAVAYSLRDLGLGAENVVRVRRSLDNAEQDFTANEITDGTLTLFCGVGDGFVSVWYNQNQTFPNLTQTTATRQPKIVSLGSLILENGNPVIQHDAVDDFLGMELDSEFVQPFTYFAVANTRIGTIIFIDNFGSSTPRLSRMNNLWQIEAGVRLTSSTDTVDFSLKTALFNSTNSEGYNNSSLVASGDAGNESLNGLTLNQIATRNNGFVSELSIAEFIIFNSAKSTERIDIETNINNYYGIY